MFQALREPPPKGSLRESLLILFVLKREQVAYARDRALVQSLIVKEKGPEAFEEFRKLAFPWVEVQKGRDREDHIRILQEEIKRGVLTVTPAEGPKKAVKSRLRTQLAESESPSDGQRRGIDMKRINVRLGAVVPR